MDQTLQDRMTEIEQDPQMPPWWNGFRDLIAEKSHDAEALTAIAQRLLKHSKNLDHTCSELWRRRDARRQEIQERIDGLSSELRSAQRRQNAAADIERKDIYAAKAALLTERINELKWVLTILY